MNAPSDDQKRQASLSCLVDAPELLRVRVLPAEFARLLGVSKQAVSRWIAAGKVSINPVDGRLDVQTAVQQVLRNTDPGRMRARVLRAAIADVQELRKSAALADERVAAVEADLATVRRDARREAGLADNLACVIDRFVERVIENEPALRATATSDAWRALVYQLDNEASADCSETIEVPDADDALAALDDP